MLLHSYGEQPPNDAVVWPWNGRQNHVLERTSKLLLAARVRVATRSTCVLRVLHRVWLPCTAELLLHHAFSIQSNTTRVQPLASVHTSAPVSLQQSVCTGPAGRGCSHHACRRRCDRTALGSARAYPLCRRANCYRWSRLHGRTGLPWMRSERALSWAGGVRWCS